MTTGMERVVAAIAGKPSDRIPVFGALFDQGARELGIPLKAYYARGEHVAEAQLRMREKYGYDNLWSLFYVGREAELLGCREILYSESGSPNVADFVIKKLDDIAKLQVPEDIASHPAFAEPLACLKRLKREAGGKYPICAYISSSMTLPAMLMGMDKWFDLLFCGPADLREELIRRCHEFFVKEVKAYRDNGADVLVYANPFGSTDTVSMKFFLAHSLPWIEKDIAAVGTTGMVYYCGTSRFNRVIDIVLKRTGLTSFSLSPLDDVAEGKRIIAGRALATGTFNDQKLFDWSPQEIRCEVKRLIDAGMPGGKFVFGIAGMGYDVPEEKIRVMFDAAFEYGAYR